MKKRWRILKPDSHFYESLAGAFGDSQIITTLLLNRGIVSATDAERFLNPCLDQLRPPFSIKDMDKAVRRVAAAVFNKEKILIFGDYDVDGITATALLLEFLQSAGIKTTFHIPHRRREGYGLQRNHIVDIAIPAAVNLIITADCGSSSHDAVIAARQAGIDVIVTDHHHVPESLPKATAVVNPKRSDCTADFGHLAGVGVVFCLLICLRKHLRDIEYWRDRQEPNLKQLCDLVALGTVADQVPLVLENRILTKIGIEQINTGNRTGIAALLDACGIRKADTADDIAFRLAPRLNAPGRLYHAKIVVKLLTSTNREVAKKTAKSLNRMNTQRQYTEKEILAEIEDHLRINPRLLAKRALVLSGSSWHEGVLGIVASRLVEKYFRPVVLISTKDDVGKGSARSIPGINLFQGLQACDDTLEAFGGHAAAAGLRIQPNMIDRFHECFETVVQKQGDADAFQPTLLIDRGLDFDEISADLLDTMERLQPFGAGNPEPLFIAENVNVVSQKIVGNNHRQMLLQQNGKCIPAIHFNIDPALPHNENHDRIAFRIRWNRWNGKKTMQIVIEAII